MTVQKGGWDYFQDQEAGVKINVAGTATPVYQENLAMSGSTANIVAASPIEISGLSVFGFPYESVTFTRTGSTGNVGLTWSVNSSGSFLFDLTWSAGADAVNITAETESGDTLNNIPHDIDGTIARTAITADSLGLLYIG